jgi:hypothetical protein
VQHFEHPAASNRCKQHWSGHAYPANASELALFLDVAKTIKTAAQNHDTGPIVAASVTHVSSLL